MVRRLAAVVAVVLGLGLVVVTPASAQPYWQTYDRDQGRWHCSSPAEVQHGVHLTACVHHNIYRDAQAVAILSNYSGSHHTITGPNVDLFADTDGDGDYDDVHYGACGSHLLLNNTSRACFGSTEPAFLSYVNAMVRVTVSGVSYRRSSGRILI
jgi:hypothetical protein